MSRTAWITACLACLLEMGCTAAKPSAPPPVPGSQVLLAEAERQLGAMRQSAYQHTTEVDEAAGIYRYDCSGFVDYALKRVLPAAYDALDRGITRTPHPVRPLAQDIHDFLAGLGTAGSAGGWRRLPRVQELAPGDLVVWLTPPGQDTTNTGHVMIVREAPARNPQRSDEYLIRVIDSASSGHASDTRGSSGAGLGSGIVGLLVDGDGRPVGFRWSGGLYQDVATSVLFGRLT